MWPDFLAEISGGEGYVWSASDVHHFGTQVFINICTKTHAT